MLYFTPSPSQGRLAAPAVIETFPAMICEAAAGGNAQGAGRYACLVLGGQRV